jgi:hypothetical protein
VRAPLTLVSASALASTETLKRLISLLLAAPLDLSEEDGRDTSDEIYLQRDHVVITLRGILLSLLRNAQFWELHNIRGSLLRRPARFWLKLD